ncbi:hypothetical protein PCANC_11072 [Puccinia coronata f. sp. avenae]|uniref:Uncharacterized protein n=1 Tax=Puccinia coronata f. sp. avenae TaxID=200324 RepID=A0A2N5UW40_9BASI|nr:hypothetical protein PCANC_11072 [Puccinia coronata f. sp. avenae]
MLRQGVIFCLLLRLGLITFKVVALPSLELTEEIQSNLGDLNQVAQSKFSPYYANASENKQTNRYLSRNDLDDQRQRSHTIHSNQLQDGELAY